MFVIEDTSGYGVLKALKEELERAVKDAEHTLARKQPRSGDYNRAMGMRGQANSTIAFILTTNVWHEGERAEKEAQQTVHYHLSCADGTVYSGDEDAVRAYLIDQGVTAADALQLAVMGYAVTQCKREACLNSGQWLAIPVPA